MNFAIRCELIGLQHIISMASTPTSDIVETHSPQSIEIDHEQRLHDNGQSEVLPNNQQQPIEESIINKDTIHVPKMATDSTKSKKRSHSDDQMEDPGDNPLKRRAGAMPTPIRKPTQLDIGPSITKPASDRWSTSLKKVAAKYSYKRIKDTHIRLLRLQCSEDLPHDSAIIGSLITVSFKDLEKGHFPYEALSYHWGPPSESYEHPVFLRDAKQLSIADTVKSLVVKKPKERYWAKQNLYNALKHLQPKKKEDEYYIWIDALCINQDDQEEKQEQVAKMAQIYTLASGVIIWLGNGNDESRRAMELIKLIGDLQTLEGEENLIKDPKRTHHWSDLADIMRRSWFSRRWVIQEIALAKEAFVRCGAEEVHWNDFKDAISFFVMHFNAIRELFRASSDFRHNVDAIGELNPLGARILVDETTNAFRRKPDGNILEPVKSLETLICSLSAFESADPRDTIYALQNVSRDTPSGNLSWVKTREPSDYPPYPDYKAPVIQVFKDFVEWVIKKSHSLDIICRQWAIADRSVTLPSWIQTVSESTWSKPAEGQARKNGDGFVGLPNQGPYSASLKFAPDVDFSPDPSQDAWISIKGLKIGTISWKSGPIADGVITADCLTKGGWEANPVGDYEDASYSSAPDKLWRTLVADRDPDGRNPPNWYHKACLRCLVTGVGPNGHINIPDLLRKPQTTTVAHYLKRAQCITWNRTFIEADSHEISSYKTGEGMTERTNNHSSRLGMEKLYGLGPPKADIGDVVCILYGCSVPCILRKINEETDEHYILVGEAYIYGKMDGEAVIDASKSGQSDDSAPPAMRFKIR